MTAGNMYKNRHALDTGLYIVKARKTRTGDLWVRAILHNLQFGYVYEIETYKIRREHLINWRLQK